MPTVYELEFSDGRENKDEEYNYFVGQGRYYVIDEQTFLNLREVLAWCFECQKMASVEDVQPISQLEAEISAMKQPGSEGYLKIFGRVAPNAEFLRDWIYRYERKLEWRKTRVSPAHCLTCGKQNLFFFPDGEWIDHPQTGEKCRLSSVGISSMVYRKFGYYDPEGNDLKPTESEYADLQVCRKAWQEREIEENPS